MTSPGGRPTGAPQRTYTAAEQRGRGMVVFAGVMLGLLALFNGLDGIAAIASSHVFLGNAYFVLGDLLAFGWLMLALAVLQAVACAGVLATGSQWARWFGVVVLGLNAFGQMFFIPSYPVWSVMIIALDVIAIYGLSVYGGREYGAVPPAPGDGARQR